MPDLPSKLAITCSLSDYTKQSTANVGCTNQKNFPTQKDFGTPSVVSSENLLQKVVWFWSGVELLFCTTKKKTMHKAGGKRYSVCISRNKPILLGKMPRKNLLQSKALKMLLKQKTTVPKSQVKSDELTSNRVATRLEHILVPKFSRCITEKVQSQKTVKSPSTKPWHS